MNRNALTLVECVLAMVVLSIGVLGMVYATTAGHHHLHGSDLQLRAVRLAEHLLEEIHARPYSGSGIGRASFCVDDYDGFSEDPGQVRSFTGELYGDHDQIFSRSVTVTAANETVADLDGASIPGKTVTVTVQDSRGVNWSLSRFICEPISP